MTPKLSSYWLYFVTSTSYKLAVNLVNSMKVEIICRENNLAEILNIGLINYKESVRLAFDQIAQQEVISRWTDALSTENLKKGISQFGKNVLVCCYAVSRNYFSRNDKKISTINYGILSIAQNTKNSGFG